MSNYSRSSEYYTVLNIPIYFKIGKKKPKNIGLNLNWFRNAHYQVSNNIKKQMHEWILNNAQKSMKLIGFMEFEYTIYRKTKRRADLGNLGAIIDKFVSDGLVEAGIIEDDNTEHIKKIVFIDGGVEKNNPRADLIIKISTSHLSIKTAP